MHRGHGIGLRRRLAHHAEAVGVAGLALVTGQALNEALSPANVALLLMLAVIFVGLRHGMAPALTTSFVCVSGMSFFHAVPLLSFQVHEIEDLVTLACFVVASFLTGSLAARLHHQLSRSSALAERNERLFEASREVAGAVSERELFASVRRAIEGALHAECVLLVADERDGLELADPFGPRLDADARADAGWCYRQVADDPEPGGRAGSWIFLRLDGEHGPVGVLGVRRRAGSGPLEPDQRILLLALREMAAVAFDRRRLADRIREAELGAEREKLRTALLTSVSHDLRTPLAGIVGAASTLVGLGKTLDEAPRRELLGTVLSEAERLDRFVANLLDMTRIEAGGPEPHPSWCDLRDVVADALRGLSRAMADRKLELRIAPSFPLLYVDALLLERVVANLLDNAAKYSPPGAPIAIEAHREGETAVIGVIDRGPGIPAAERESVFHLFHRLRDRDQRIAGTGLGLRICRGLSEALRGSIRVLDGPDALGTCVEIRVPVGREAAGPEAR